jgi:hypothetical protein
MRCNSKFSSKPPQNFELKRVVERLSTRCSSPYCQVLGRDGQSEIRERGRREGEEEATESEKRWRREVRLLVLL